MVYTFKKGDIVVFKSTPESVAYARHANGDVQRVKDGVLGVYLEEIDDLEVEVSILGERVKTYVWSLHPVPKTEDTIARVIRNKRIKGNA